MQASPDPHIKAARAALRRAPRARLGPRRGGVELGAEFLLALELLPVLSASTAVALGARRASRGAVHG